jgi:hypothetical protein
VLVLAWLATSVLTGLEFRRRTAVSGKAAE